MCGIAGIVDIKSQPCPNLPAHLKRMNRLQAHRGPDGEGIWIHPRRHAALGHRRLSIIDLVTGEQPMTAPSGNTIVFNGEIYNYLELRRELAHFRFRTNSDTEVILAAYEHWGVDCVEHLRGMFAFALWDEEQKRLFCARDRFGMKPFYYARVQNHFLFSSEAKALLPFLPRIDVNLDALRDYLVFQFNWGGKTLFKDVEELPPAHYILVQNETISVRRYWEVYYALDLDHTQKYFEEKLRALIEDSVNLHMRSDVPVGAYLSGGLDSTIMAVLGARRSQAADFEVFHGKFAIGGTYDESRYAREVAAKEGMKYNEINITSDDFVGAIRRIIYHLDYPVAGPGSFPQYFVSKLAAERRKVVLGGQGGDELFGGYVRYLIAYFEQCIKGAIDGTLHQGDFIITYESIIPNLIALRNYKPLLKEFWSSGLFEALDRRYFHLINRGNNLKAEINWECLGEDRAFKRFSGAFNSTNVKSKSYFDSMTHFDFKTLLPALLHVEDRMSMAHGLESRVPFLDHPIVEFAATMPASVKFRNGTLKKVLLNAMREFVPSAVCERQDKMGFPVPLNEWLKGELREYFIDTFSCRSAKTRPYFNSKEIVAGINNEPQFGRKIWGLLCLELWHQEFIDQGHQFQGIEGEACFDYQSDGVPCVQGTSHEGGL
jgi:asparagine synthase (glutamine-hydrolysing)